MSAKLIKFSAKPRGTIVVQQSRPPFGPVPLSPEVIKALGLGPGLVLYGGPLPADQKGMASLRQLLKA